MSKLTRRLAPLIAALALLGGGTAVVLNEGLSPVQSATGSIHPPGWGGTPAGFVAPSSPGLTAIPTGTMYDAVTLGNIPARPFAVAGYVAGTWPTWTGCAACGGSLAGRFPAAHRVSIAIHLGEHAMCGDFEPGDMDSSQAGAWAAQDLAAGFKKPCAYGDLSNMPAIKASLASALGSRWRTRVLLWLAWYRNIPGLVSGYDAVQYTDNALGRSLDENTVTLAFLQIATPPYVPPKPLPVCFHNRETRAACNAAKAKVASAQRGAASSQRAYVARGCPTLSQRVSWYSTQLRKHPKTKTASRKSALAASRRAYKRQACSVFLGRVKGNQAAVKRIQAAN